ncbi:MAG: glycerate kinase [Longibaculum sp.]
MKIVIAPDSYKESMSAKQACYAIEKGIHQYDSTMETLLCPLADGGEGTLETLVEARNGTLVYEEVSGVLFDKIKAPIGYIEDCAIIECAKVCGLELLNENQKDPYQTTTLGLGELILKALDHHVHRLMICLGGSATNDGGIGMLSALGVKFYNQYHQPVQLTMAGLSEIASIDISNLDKRLHEIEIIGVCDVDNPLCGHQGATYIYGGQKGVKAQEMAKIDKDMEAYAKRVDDMLKSDYRLKDGSGAAGGLGYALLAFCHAKLQKGFDVVSEITQLEEKIKASDCVIVGEGKMDRQTQFGKTPYGVLQIAKTYHKPVFAFAGKVEDSSLLQEIGFQNIYAISPLDIPLNIALKNGQDYLQKCVYQHMEEIIHGL